jgi:hypothetical protein
MSQTQTLTAPPSATEWCAQLQAKMMAALDAAWDLAERSDDPAVLLKARDKARLCGQMAAAARKIAALVPAPKVRAAAETPVPEAFGEVRAQVAALEAAVEVTGALDPGAAPGKPPAAQAVAMRAALRKLGRR